MVDGQDTLQGVHPILRNPDLPNPTASPTLMSPRSQVRFSVPDTSFMNEAQVSVSESPSKIVFPKGSEEDSVYETANEEIGDEFRNLGKEGHFMDMHSRVMIDVPEEIWDFHTRRLIKHRRSRSTGDQSIYNGNANGNLEMSRSLQSIIVDTLDSMGKFKEKYRAENSNSEDSSGISQVSPLNLRRETNYDLYLTPYSPLNNYDVPIPLEISLPPYLSPKNKERKRSSLIFDGKHYSPFNMDSFESSAEEDVEDRDRLNESSHMSADAEEEGSISADSIPSAVHDISFDVSSLHDVDEELGIDQDANVNLKVQRKNLKRQSPSKSSPLTRKSHTKSASRNLNDQQVPDLPPTQEPEVADEPPLDQEGIEEEEKNEQEALAPVLSKKSLDILETPSKQIYIPDFDSDPTPATSTAGSLKFFDTLDDREEGHEEAFTTNPNREVDILDMTFKFPPLPPKEDESHEEKDTSNPNREAHNLDMAFKFPPSPPKEDADFLRVDNSPVDPQFESRRSKLMQQKVLTPGGRRHMHSRSRSMHNVQDMFAATSTPPTAAPAAITTTTNNNNNTETPSGSPLRQNYAVQEGAALFEMDKQKEQIPPRESPRGFAEDEYGLPTTPTPFARFNGDLPVTPSSTGRNRSELAMTPTPFSRRRRGKPVTPTSFEEQVHEVDMTPESEPYVEHEEESDPSSVYEEVHALKEQPSHEQPEPTRNQEDFVSQDQSSYNKTDESLKIISEKNLNYDHFDFSDEVEREVALSTPVKQKELSPPPVSPVNPMTSFQSFTRPVIPPENEYENIVSMPPEHNKINYNLLSPGRSLSNNGSESSKNSQFSKNTNQSSRTSYPAEREMINPLVENLKKSDVLYSFPYPFDPVLNNAMKLQRHSMPAFDVYNGSAPSFRQLNEEISFQDNDRYKQGLHQQQPDIPADKSAQRVYSRPKSVIGPGAYVEDQVSSNVGPRSEVPSCNQRKGQMHHRSRSLEQSTYPRALNDYHGESYHEPKDHLLSQNTMRPRSFHAPRRSIQSFMADDLYGPDDYRMFEDYQNVNQHAQEDDSERPADVVSYPHRLAPSADFRDVLETLDNMSPSTQRSKEFSSREPDHYTLPETPVRSKRNAATDEGYRTEYEVRDGKLVEVLVLDDDSDESIHNQSEKDSPLSPSKVSQYSSPNRNHEELLKMCEDTATHAKKVILQLVDDKKTKKAGGKKKKLSRPPPPVTTKEVEQVARLTPRQNNHRRSSSIGQERYLRNLHRAMKSKPYPQ
ncbi:hypothetical protein ZYGR_0P03470 [Zygosaccharomyces rouxii]|uniref:Uncharacterized protein n=1 Tax=Zygosaccharomyces rouxii TaxID=4956 RepID=A0A1Q3A1W2_ZYGRO|nr:hypothetical protein ZYGR_0P03470 [Zygosaccharomyces rouxii]